MSFIQGQGPIHAGKINLLTGGGSKITDPLGIYKTTQPAVPPPAPLNQVPPWVDPLAAQRASAAVSGGDPNKDNPTDDSTLLTKKTVTQALGAAGDASEDQS